MTQTDYRFIRACRREPVDKTPVWFMRQAGRYMPEYRAIRANHTLLDICAQPELAAEVTLQPVNALDIDAAIIFADILLPLVPMGIQLRFAKGEGPVIDNPVRTAADVDALKVLDPEEATPTTLEAVSIVSKELEGRMPLIGFAGGPFTVASYMIEGGSSRNYLHMKGLMYGEPEIWDRLMTKLSDMTARYLLGQIRAGASAVQIFDSWAGALSPHDYRQRVMPYVQQIVDAIKPTGVPTIIFGTSTAGLLSTFSELGTDVVGADWRIDMESAWNLIGHDRAIQGNLDPALLFGPRDELDRQVQRILGEVSGRPGHIFNLGHGILPETPVDNVKFVAERVHELTGN